MKNSIVHFICDEWGGTAMEYSLIGAVVALVCIPALLLMRTGLNTLFMEITDAITQAISSS